MINMTQISSNFSLKIVLSGLLEVWIFKKFSSDTNLSANLRDKNSEELTTMSACGNKGNPITFN